MDNYFKIMSIARKYQKENLPEFNFPDTISMDNYSEINNWYRIVLSHIIENIR